MVCQPNFHVCDNKVLTDLQMVQLTKSMVVYTVYEWY